MHHIWIATCLVDKVRLSVDQEWICAESNVVCGHPDAQNIGQPFLLSVNALLQFLVLKSNQIKVFLVDGSYDISYVSSLLFSSKEIKNLFFRNWISIYKTYSIMHSKNNIRIKENSAGWLQNLYFLIWLDNFVTNFENTMDKHITNEEVVVRNH